MLLTLFSRDFWTKMVLWVMRTTIFVDRAKSSTESGARASCCWREKEESSLIIDAYCRTWGSGAERIWHGRPQTSATVSDSWLEGKRRKAKRQWFYVLSPNHWKDAKSVSATHHLVAGLHWESRTKLSFLKQDVLAAFPIALFVIPSDFGMGEWQWLQWIIQPMVDRSWWL